MELITSSNAVFSQEQDTVWLDQQWYYSTDDFFIDFNFLLPPFLRDDLTLKRYIRDPRFLQLRSLYADTLAIDAIFDHALLIAEEDIAHALLIATLATMDHFKVGIKIPYIGTIFLPLTTETHNSFYSRRKNLPTTILPDSIGKKIIDRDKLQHFFGSAYLTYINGATSLANLLGNFIEWGEDSFIVDGEYDERDKFANRLGQEFGLRLLEDEDVLPSDVLWK